MPPKMLSMWGMRLPSSFSSLVTTSGWLLAKVRHCRAKHQALKDTPERLKKEQTKNKQ